MNGIDPPRVAEAKGRALPPSPPKKNEVAS